MILLWEALQGRNGHDTGRSLLEKAYRRMFDREMPQIVLTDRGKPYFTQGHGHFSISHTKNHAFCCLAETPVGLDAEEIDRKIDLSLADRILSPSEKRRFAAAEDQRAALLRLWVLKEALAKLTGRGWGNYLRETDFDPQDPRIRVLAGCYVAVLTQDR